MLNPNVAVVLDPNYGNRLAEMARHLHVWVCASPANKLAVEAVWKESGLYEAGVGATLFGVCENPEEAFLDNLDTIELHHPHWESMYIYGLDWTPQVKQVLAEHGVTKFISMTEGFVATRPTPPVT